MRILRTAWFLLFAAGAIGLPLKAASLFLNVQSPGSINVAPLLYLEDIQSAGSSDMATYSNTASGQLGGGTFSHSAAGRAAFGNLGASISMSAGGIFLGNPVGNGWVQAEFGDTVSYSAVSGTPEYLQVDLHVDGVGSASSASRWSISAQTIFGGAVFSFSSQCSYPNFVSPLECSGQVGLNPSNSGTPVFQTAGQSSIQTWNIPLTWIQPSGNSFALSSSLGPAVQLWQNGNIGPSSFTQSNYLNSSLVGGFRLLDANLAPLDAQFTSQSGHDYSQPLSAVPEPGSIMLLSCGMVAIWLRRRLR